MLPDVKCDMHGMYSQMQSIKIVPRRQFFALLYNLRRKIVTCITFLQCVQLLMHGFWNDTDAVA